MTYKVNKPITKRVVALFEKEEIERIDKTGMSIGMRSRSDAIRTFVKVGIETLDKEKGVTEAATSSRHVQPIHTANEEKNLEQSNR